MAANKLRTTSKPADTEQPNAVVADQFLSEEQVLQQQADALEAQKQALAARRKQAADEANARKLQTLEDLKADAENFRASARAEADEASKKDYLRWAADAEKQAADLARELGLNQPETEADSEEKQAVATYRKHRLRAIGQAVVLLLVLVGLYSCFVGVGDEIKQSNEAAYKAAKAMEAKGIDPGAVEMMRPYDDTSLQKFLLEKFWEFADLLTTPLKLLMVAPFALFYLLPFMRSKRDFLTEFFNELTPYERCKIALGFIAAFLLHSGLVHMVKP